MKGDLVLEREDDKRRDKRNVDYLKKVRSKNRKKIIIVATSLLSIFLILITTYYFVFENMWLVKSDNVETIIQKRDTLVTLTFKAKKDNHYIIVTDRVSAEGYTDTI